MGEPTKCLMTCPVTGKPVQALIRAGSGPDRVRIIACLGKTDPCYEHGCVFATDGGEVCLVELQPYSAAGI